jgi:pyruvate dehydrogenase E2 component (dihydrolipoamide acetyltransferase)
MPISITMPALSPTMEEGNLVKWHVKVGDKVKPGDVLAEIETDKATMEVEAVDEGVVSKLLVDEGAQGVKVNAVIAELSGEGEAPAKGNGGGAKAEPAKVEAKPNPGPPAARPASAPQRAEQPTVAVVQSAGRSADAPHPGGPRSQAPASGQRIKASPLAKRLAKAEGVDLLALKGSGPHGRIIKADVLKAPKGRAGRSADAPHPGAPPIGVPSLIEPAILDERVYLPGTFELTPLDGVRKVTAKRLTQSFMQVPHFPLTIDLEIDHLLSARVRINEAGQAAGVKVSVNDMLIKACAMALMAQPDANASYTDKGIAQHKSAHVSVAVAIEGGLITPVVRDAQSKGLAQIAAEMKDLAARARERKLKPQEYMGGTFSISNLGMFGIKEFASIINQPEGMILSVGAGEKRPVVKDDKIVIATMMSVTLTCDHRVVDGATGAKWLQHFKQFVETPEAMLL